MWKLKLFEGSLVISICQTRVTVIARAGEEPGGTCVGEGLAFRPQLVRGLSKLLSPLHLHLLSYEMATMIPP